MSCFSRAPINACQPCLGADENDISTLVDNGDGTFTHVAGEVETVIDVCNLVVAGGCIATLEAGPGDTQYTFTDATGATTVFDINEIDFDVNDITLAGPVITFTAENGNTVDIDICAAVAANCNATLVVNADGSLTHTANDGTVTEVPAPAYSTVVDNGDGSFTHTSGDGTVTTWAETVTTLVDNGDGTYTYTSEDGTVTVVAPTVTVTDNADGTITIAGPDGTDDIVDLCAIIAANCPDSLVDNGDGTYTHTAIDGAEVTFNVTPSSITPVVTDGNEIATHDNGDGTVTSIQETITTLVDNGDGTYTYTDEDGTETVIAPSVTVTDNGDGTLTVSGPDATDDIVDICAIVAANCSDSMVVNADGSVTHTAIDGTVVTIPAPVPSTLVDNGDGSFTHTSGDGTSVTWDETTTTLAANPDGSYTYTNEDGVTSDIAAPTFSDIVDNGDGTVTHTAGDGTVTVLDACTIIQSGGCTPTVTPGPGQFEYTFDDGYGNTQVIAVNELDADITDIDVTGTTVTFTAQDGTTISIDICQIVALNCNSSLTVNANGTYTHQANNGDITIFGPFVSDVTDNGDGTVTVTDTAGSTVEILDICAIVAANCSDSLVDNGDGTLTHTSIDGTVTVIDTNETVTTLVDNADGSYTYTSEDGTETIFFVNGGPVSTVTDNGDGTISHDPGDGTPPVVIDICDIIAQNCSDVLVYDPVAGTVTHTAVDGTVTTFPVGSETVTTLVDNGDGTATYTSEDGTVTTIILDGGPASIYTNNGDGTLSLDPGDGTAPTVVNVCDMIADAGCSGGGGAETPDGAPYPDSDSNGLIEIGLEDQNGTPLPGFDGTSGEWNIPVDVVVDLGGALPAAPTEETNLPFAVYDTVAVGGSVFVEAQYVWDPITSNYIKVLQCKRDSVIDSDIYSAATATTIGDHPATPLCANDGVLQGAWVSADGSALTADTTVNVVVGGAVIGTALIPAGSSPSSQVVVALTSTPTGITGGDSGTFTLAGDGSGDIDDVVVTFDFGC